MFNCCLDHLCAAESVRGLLRLLLCRDARARPSVRDVLCFHPSLQHATQALHYNSTRKIPYPTRRVMILIIVIVKTHTHMQSTQTSSHRGQASLPLLYIHMTIELHLSNMTGSSASDLPSPPSPPFFFICDSAGACAISAREAGSVGAALAGSPNGPPVARHGPPLQRVGHV